MPLVDVLDMTMSDSQFAHVANLLRDRLGINVEAEKRPMLTARLQHLVRKSGCHSFDQYFARHLVRLDRGTLSTLADDLSTNHTFFWREAAHFEAFREVVLPEARARHESDRDVRVWCAAASTGQEPHTLVMLMREVWGPAYGGWALGVLATDISDRVLSVARRAEYDAEDVGRLPAVLRTKYLTPSEGKYRVREDIRSQVTFRRLNLVAERWPFRGKFDCIFLRNVLIYFNTDTKQKLLRNLASHLAPNGYVFVGMAETLRNLAPRFHLIQPGMYQMIGR